MHRIPINAEDRKILAAARSKIADASRWTQKSMARDSNGDKVRPESAAAVCWCAEGAIKALGGRPGILGRFVTQFASELFRGRPLYVLNDVGSHADVIKALDKAIKSTDTHLTMPG